MAISDGDRYEAYMQRVRPSHLEGFVAMLRRRAAFIANVTLACAALSLAYILFAPPKYTASGQLLIDPPLSRSAGSNAAADGTVEGGSVEVEDPIKVIKSGSVLDKVVARENLESDPLFGMRPRGVLTALLTGIGIVPTDPHAMALRQLDRAVSVTRSSGSSGVNVDVVTSNPETSARVANAVMDSYEQETDKLAGTARRTAPPDPRIEMLQVRVREAEQRYEAVRKGEGTVAALEKQANELPGRIADAEAKVTGLRTALTQMQRAKDERDFRIIPESLRTETLNSLKNRYLAASRIEADLSERAGARNAARQQMAEVTGLLDKAIGEGVQSTAAELERARSNVTQLKSQLEASKKDLRGANEASVRLKELERDVEASRANYQAFLMQSRDSGEQRQLGNVSARIVSRATPPLERSGSSPLRILFNNVLLGLGFAISLAWLLELMDERKGKGVLPHVTRR